MPEASAGRRILQLALTPTRQLAPRNSSREPLRKHPSFTLITGSTHLQRAGGALELRSSMQPALMNSLRCYLENDAAGGLAELRAAGSTCVKDPEVRFYMARQAARFEDVPLALRLLRESLMSGYGSSLALVHDPWLRILHGRPEFEQVLAMAREQELVACAALSKAGGDLVLPSSTLAASSGSPV